MDKPKLKILNYNKVKHDIRCGIHSGFPFCCVFFYSLILNPIEISWKPVRIRLWKEKDVKVWCQPFDLQLREKSARGLISLALMNIRTAYYNCQCTFFSGEYFACPICMTGLRKPKIKANRCDCYECECSSEADKIQKNEVGNWSIPKTIIKGFLEKMSTNKKRYKVTCRAVPFSTPNLLKLLALMTRETKRDRDEERVRLG